MGLLRCANKMFQSPNMSEVQSRGNEKENAPRNEKGNENWNEKGNEKENAPRNEKGNEKWNEKGGSTSTAAPARNSAVAPET